jgi:hypothetical protein
MILSKEVFSENQDDFAKKISFGDDWMNRQNCGDSAVVAQRGEVAAKQVSLLYIQVSRLDPVVFIHRPAIDVEIAATHLHFLTRKPDDAFHRQTIRVPHDDDVAPDGFSVMVGPSIDDQQIAGFESGGHAVAADNAQSVVGTKKHSQRE